MKNTSRKSILRFILVTLLILLMVVFTIFLYNWSKKLSIEYDRNQLKNNVQEVLNRDGELGLFSLADIKVDEILYDEDSVSVVLDDSSSWLYTSEEMLNIKIYEKCKDSVVHIAGNSNTSDIFSYDQISKSGSGVVLSSKGDILTNYHVIEDLDNIVVTLADGSYYNAVVTGSDSIDDIALIKIDVDKKILKPIELGNSFNLKVGQKVYAIGNPYGYDRTLTTGVVSGLDRAVQTSDDALIMGMIQTDASINPGNSGGPLINSHYQMIGMNTSVYNGHTNMNFAIPIDTILSIIPDLITSGKVMRGWLDIVPVQLTQQLADYAKLDVKKGILISQVVKNGKAEDAGLKGGNIKVSYGASTLYLGGDVITKIGTKKIETYNDFYNALLTTRMGEKVKVTIYRDGKEITKSVELVERSDKLDRILQ